MSTEFQHQLNNKDDINKLIQKFQETEDEELQLALVKKYENLVLSLTKRFSKGRGYDEDLVQVGMIGLLAAIRRFDTTYGKSFETFAIPTIIGEVKRFIRDKTWSVHVPRRIKELGPRIRQAVDDLTNEHQRSPRVEELAAHLDVTEEEILETMEMGKSYQALSVDKPIEADLEGSSVTLLDLVGSEEGGYEHTDLQLVLGKAFQSLSTREKAIVQYTYFKQLSQKETGEKLGISQMHVSRLQRRALEKLRNAIQMEQSECL